MFSNKSNRREEYKDEKKSKSEKMVIIDTTIGCLLFLAGAIACFYFGNLMQHESNENVR